jgi:hypothetical protein
MIWVAPAKFLGNRDADYGGTLTFDRRLTTTANYTPTNDVTLEGGGLSAHFKLATPPGTSWTRQRVVLLPGNTNDGTTAATLHTVLANLTALRIEGEYVNGGETDSLDNVVLATPAVKAPKITSASLATFKEGTTHTFKVTATGSPTPALSIDGTLPAGLTFTDHGDGTGSLSGTPAAGSAGTYTVTVNATSTSGTATQTLTIQVAQAPHFTSARSTSFANGTPSSFTVTTTGYPAPAITETGALPPGVTFTDNGDGTATLAGTPGGGAATYRLSLTAKNAGGSATQTLTLTVPG